MNRLARGLVGGVASGLLICLAMFLGFIGGIHSAFGSGFQMLEPDVVPGVVVAVDEIEQRVTVRYTPESDANGGGGRTAGLPMERSRGTVGGHRWTRCPLPVTAFRSSTYPGSPMRRPRSTPWGRRPAGRACSARAVGSCW